jgi:hypothetical protein
MACGFSVMDRVTCEDKAQMMEDLRPPPPHSEISTFSSPFVQMGKCRRLDSVGVR